MSNTDRLIEKSQESSRVSDLSESRLDDRRVLIVGANGQLGKALQAKYPNAQTADVSELDITDKSSVDNYNWDNVDVILNAAAYTNVDGAETQEGRIAAWKVNATAVGYLANVANKHDLTLVHVSTEYVFDGTKEIHKVSEPLSPLGVYAQTKAASEIAASLANKHYIIRVSWLIGDGHNFVRTMMGLAEKNVSPTVVADQIGRLTFTSTLTHAIHHLLSPTSQSPSPIPYGTYQLSNTGESASWADITRKIFKNMNRDDLSVIDTTTAEYYKDKQGIAPRPLQSTMDLSKLVSTGFIIPAWEKELARYIEQEIKERDS